MRRVLTEYDRNSNAGVFRLLQRGLNKKYIHMWSLACSWCSSDRIRQKYDNKGGGGSRVGTGYDRNSNVGCGRRELIHRRTTIQTWAIALFCVPWRILQNYGDQSGGREFGQNMTEIQTHACVVSSHLGKRKQSYNIAGVFGDFGQNRAEIRTRVYSVHCNAG